MRYAKDGRLQCNQCFKKFSGWPAFMAHFNQKSCPVLRTKGQEAEGPSSIGDSSACGTLAPGGGLQTRPSTKATHVFQLQSTKDIACAGVLSRLASHLRQFGKPDKCSECGVRCNPMYISRHACKQHPWMKQANFQDTEWVGNSQIPSNPCQWCGSQYKTTNKAHGNACPMLCVCGQLFHKYSPRPLRSRFPPWLRLATRNRLGHRSSFQSCQQTGARPSTTADTPEATTN